MNEGIMASIPQCAKNLRQKGTEIKAVGKAYYLCKVSSNSDPEKKRARKISGDYLDILAPQGLNPSHHRRLQIDA
jgi:hypothetical protein